ncbi:MAG: site-specific integrase, partial [Pseudomonadota bacterium]
MADKVLLQEFTHWLRVERRYSDHTIAAYSRDLAGFMGFMGEHAGKIIDAQTLASLRAIDFRAWLASLRNAGKTNTSMARNLSAVRSFFKWAEKHNHFKNPAIVMIKTPKLPHAVPRPLNVQDAQDIVQNCDEHKAAWVGLRDHALLMVLWGCGLRISEALALNHNDIPKQGTKLLRVLGKGNKERIVPLLDTVYKAI